MTTPSTTAERDAQIARITANTNIMLYGNPNGSIWTRDANTN